MVVVAVIGASGFIGSAAVKALARHGATVREVTSPRLPPTPEGSDPDVAVKRHSATSISLAQEFEGADVVVCCAGNADAANPNSPALVSANAVLPGVIGAACTVARVRRFIHVSSAGVQGRLKMLDSSDQFDPFSPYTHSKVAGEKMARAHGPSETTIYRPPGTHHSSRQVTHRLRLIARSHLGIVAAPGDDPTPQTLIGNVADALAFLALNHDTLPSVVHHPSEGLTTSAILEYLGGKSPWLIPRPLARALVSSLSAAGRYSARVAVDARRLEMLMFGQEQAPSWLTEHGWSPSYGSEAWRALGARLSGDSAQEAAPRAVQR